MVCACALDGVVPKQGCAPAAQGLPSGNWPSAMKVTEPRPLSCKRAWALGTGSVAPQFCGQELHSSGPWAWAFDLGPLLGVVLILLLAEAHIGLLQVQAARLRRGGSSQSQQFQFGSWKVMFAPLRSQVWKGGQWRALPWALIHAQAVLGGQGPGAVKEPLGAFALQKQALVFHTTFTRLVASVAVTSWPQLTPLGLCCF